MRAEELRPQAERIAVGPAETEAVPERRVIDREELVEALAPLRTWRECPLRVRGVASAVVEEASGPGIVVPHRHGAATVEVLAVDYRRIVELVATTWWGRRVRRGEASSVGNWRRPGRSPCRPFTAGQPCPEQPCQQTWNGPGCDQPGLFSVAWLTVRREVFQRLARERLGAAAAAQGSRSAPGLIRVAGGFPRCSIHAPVPPVRIRGVHTFPLRAIGRVPRPMRHMVTAPARQLARRGRPGCTEAHHRHLGSRVLWSRTALAPEPGPAAMLRTSSRRHGVFPVHHPLCSQLRLFH